MNIEDVDRSGSNSRENHLDWCKQRAIKNCERGDAGKALSAFFLDLESHTETAMHPGCTVGRILRLDGKLSDQPAVLAFIDCFR